ncbi:hypothetical protein GC175_27085 [bacterium]|nr:hypothetical protein [bacterium]
MNNSFDKWISGDAIPRRGNWFSRTFAAAALQLFGWKAVGELPNLPKFLLVGVPHTSNLDGVLAVFVLMAAGVELHWMVKKEVFDNPFGGLLRWLGGVAVDRKSPQDVVGQMVDRFEKRDKFVVVIAPEGTRKRVERWKTGFYRIALAAEVPIVLVYADYAKREIGIGPVVQPSGDLEKEMAEMRAFADTITPRHPDRA